ncbi:MAG: hypothetical protein ABI876_18055, partial [Bacteroidota bacterium]
MLLFIASAKLTAQSRYYPDQPLPTNLFLPLIPIHGFNDTTFIIGGEMATRGTDGTVTDMWSFARSIGLNLMEFRSENPVQKADTVQSATHDGEQLMCWLDKYSWESGWGRQVTFYPFDYAESYYWKCLFLSRSGGTLKQNPEERYHDSSASEQVYDSSNTTPGATVASHIVFGYDPIQIYQWPYGVAGDHYYQIENTETVISRSHFNYGRASWYITVAAHLFDPSDPLSGGGGATDTAA